MLCSRQGSQNGTCCKTPAPIESSDDNEDVWGSDEESIAVYADLKRAHGKQGYLDGLVNQQEASLQKGFDSGFPIGADLGRDVGRILARLHGTPAFKEAVEALNVSKILDKKYFDDQLDLAKSNHPIISSYDR